MDNEHVVTNTIQSEAVSAAQRSSTVEYGSILNVERGAAETASVPAHPPLTAKRKKLMNREGDNPYFITKRSAIKQSNPIRSGFRSSSFNIKFHINVQLSSPTRMSTFHAHF